MSTGPDHYRKAEMLIGKVRRSADHFELQQRLAEAQIHATLALAAATALRPDAELTDDFVAWEFAAGEYSAQRRKRTAAATPERSDAEIVTELNAVFGEPVEGRDYGVMPNAPVEYFDQAEVDDVRAIRREMADEAGDDSEAIRQEAEDDARHERAVYLAEREAYRVAEVEVNNHHDYDDSHEDGGEF